MVLHIFQSEKIHPQNLLSMLKVLRMIFINFGLERIMELYLVERYLMLTQVERWFMMQMLLLGKNILFFV